MKSWYALAPRRTTPVPPHLQLRAATDVHLSIPTRRRLAPQTGRTSIRNSSPSSSPAPSWFRAVALFCAFLVGIGSTAQACHSHDDLPSAAKSSRNGVPPAAPDHCPLCVAMHSALPASAQGEPVRVHSVQVLLPSDPRPRVTQYSVFDLFSRPPPALSPRTAADGRHGGTHRFMHSPEV